MIAPTCVFCDILDGKIPGDVVAETPLSLAFRDIAPQAPTHVLVIPRQHVPNLVALVEYPEALVDLIQLAGAVADQEGLERGYRLVANTGSEGGQVVYHAHLHVMGGRPLQRMG